MRKLTGVRILSLFLLTSRRESEGEHQTCVCWSSCACLASCSYPRQAPEPPLQGLPVLSYAHLHAHLQSSNPPVPWPLRDTSPSGSRSYIWTTARLLLKASKAPVSLQTTLFLHLSLLSSLALHMHTKSQTDLDNGKVCSRARVRTQLCGPRQSCPTVTSFLPRHRYQNLKFKEGV